MERLTGDLKSSWKHLRAIARQETSTNTTSMEKKMKYAQSLTDAAERLRVLETIYKRVLNRFHKLLLYMGMSRPQVEKQRVSYLYQGYQQYLLCTVVPLWRPQK